MSYTIRRQRVAYDNLAIGSAATQENMLVGTDVPGYLLNGVAAALPATPCAAAAAAALDTS
jgi:thiol:disulfide interchange protein